MKNFNKKKPNLLLDFRRLHELLLQRFPESPLPDVLARRRNPVRPQILLVHLVRILLLLVLAGRLLLDDRRIRFRFADQQLAHVRRFVKTLTIDRLHRLDNRWNVDNLGVQQIMIQTHFPVSHVVLQFDGQSVLQVVGALADRVAQYFGRFLGIVLRFNWLVVLL